MRVIYFIFLGSTGQLRLQRSPGDREWVLIVLHKWIPGVFQANRQCLARLSDISWVPFERRFGCCDCGRGSALCGAHLLKVLRSEALFVDLEVVLLVQFPEVCFSSRVLRDVFEVGPPASEEWTLRFPAVVLLFTDRWHRPSAHHGFIVTSGGCGERISLEMVVLAVFALLRPTEGLTPPGGTAVVPIVFHLLQQLATCRTGCAKVFLEVVLVFWPEISSVRSVLLIYSHQTDAKSAWNGTRVPDTEW